MKSSQRINRRWLVRLRYLAAFGQILVVAGAVGGLHLPLPVLPLAGLTALTLLSNVWLARVQSDKAQAGVALEGFVLVFDVLILTAFLGLTGGAHNPFSVFYLVHVTLGAVALRPVWVWILAATSVICFGLLFLLQTHLPILSGEAHYALHLQGMWLAHVAAAGVIAFLVSGLVSELRRRDKALRDHEHLVSLATLAAGAAHELNTPLGTIAVVTGELERKAQSAESREDLHLILSQVQRCKSILQAMAVCDSNDDSAPQTVRLERFCRHTLAKLSPDMQARVQFQSSSFEDLSIASIPAKLEPVLLNLLKNALEAGADVSVPSPVHFSLQAGETQVELQVEDQGHGMDDETLARLGEPFFTTKPPGCGMGLGLFLTRELVTQLGGTLKFSSVPGRGTRATLALPMQGRGSAHV